MNRYRIALPVILLIAWFGLPAVAEETNSQGRSVSGSGSECTCPKEGHWNVKNLEGWMDCTGPINFRKKLGEVKDEGTIWVLEEDCSSLFGEASRKRDEDVLMERVENCEYKGTISGEEDGVNMVIEVNWVFENEEFLKGEMHSNPSVQGMTCEFYRPFEISFDQAIQDKEYEKLKKKMEKKLKKIRDSK